MEKKRELTGKRLEGVFKRMAAEVIYRYWERNDVKGVIGAMEKMADHAARTLNGFGQSSERSSGNDMVGCFSLSDVWQFYVEKSFYGASVPILLNNGESVVQYYAPSLSAIQIYTTKPCESISVSVSNHNSSTRTSQHTILLVDHHEGPSKIMESLGHLYFQFNETFSPYDRLPLTTKINELAEAHPGLTTFNSMDLSPYSWIAVAWCNFSRGTIIDR
ncbi:uncharacterized protein LOC126728225 [Quercus robur]|uniref:uncharacterized protein LOC126728225 n=1 Tax=Quercus robur TaxID=38942 RepID=UPI002162F78D|nr:uncharacterized protein LOC126728225 [Quercus robur]